MNKALYLPAIALLLGSLLGGCEKEGPAEQAGKEIDQAVEQAGEKIEEAGDKIREETSQ